jgi:hypothetical protein
MELDSKRFADAVVLYPVGRIDHATAEGVAEATLTLEGLDVTTPCFIAPRDRHSWVPLRSKVSSWASTPSQSV